MRKPISLFLLLAGLTGIAAAQDKPVKDSTMTRLLDYSRPNEHHAVLGLLAGKWTFQDTKLVFVKGTIVRNPIYDGRFYTVEVTGGKLPLPIAGGKMKEDNYRGYQIEGYDNGRGLYVSISINNHIGSDIEMETGVYDSVAKTITYSWENELLPGEKEKEQLVLKFIDKDTYTEEYSEERNGSFVKVRELKYTRIKE